MVNNGYSLSVVCLGIYFFLVGWLGSSISLLTTLKDVRRVIVVAFLFMISFPLGYLLCDWGSEQFIVKYDAVFSAMQFLLSADRSHLISGDDLRMRFFIMHFGLLLLIFMTQAPVYMAFSSSVNQKTPN
ncbi:hypothetical protein [Methylomonas albis]|uniref:Uncharacterized protein n=2 Tax=Methylomonas albis TaxID=1854563 RepID=A0ABR9D4A4_9GAMM|nr:hypothetical protein [Methylomonas albis]MBD9357745.1 hypothetical protein [Methylomonas albis]